MKFYFLKNKYKFRKVNKNSGFTLVETMVSVSLFLVVVTVGIDSLLNVSTLHIKSQNIRSIMDSLSFVMEDMSRNIRTGMNYRCITDSDTTSIAPADCTSGSGLSFKSSYGNQWVYIVDSDGTIKKSTSGGTLGSFSTLTPPEVKVDSFSGFSVIGSETYSSNDYRQPFITIRISGTVTSKNGVEPFLLQTSISSRLSDINN